MSASEARAWRETVTIPTYGVGDPDRNPMFLEKRVYQGSSGAVYPLPVIDRILDETSDEQYEGIFLENEYLRILVLPQLGGRVHMALDKTNGHQFVYHNRVIKPALVGLAGPWISGGIEFNWPQHHRPSTFLPVDSDIVENEDGSVTVWLGEIDRMHRTGGMHGLTLHVGRAILEVRVRLQNRTDLPQTFLWWANPAVHVDENHQSIFPPDVRAVMDHGKRDVSDFPIATGTYYKVDYSPGTDISRYRNIPVPTSYMAHHSEYDFVGSYDHGRGAGLLHVADHHISPGKKQWTWGHGDFGRAWDRQLTDEDGPYVELMCGVYTDNQPDFSWLAPGEEKAFSQFFMPYKGVGVVKNATAEAVVGLEVGVGRATVRVYTTAEYPGARVCLRAAGETLVEETVDASPRSFFETTVELEPGVSRGALELTVSDASGRELVGWRATESGETALPDPARAIDGPAGLDSVESLVLAGLHLEQYRHATREPGDYYGEALRRDPGSLLANTALGRLLYRRGRFPEAEACLRRAIERSTRHNPNPLDGEPQYLLGLALLRQERRDEAVDAFSKAAWSGAWQEVSWFELARIALRRGQLTRALDLLDGTLARNAANHRAVHLKICLLAHLERIDEAARLGREELGRAPFNAGVRYELALLTGESLDGYDRAVRSSLHNDLELAIDHAAAGLWHRAVAILGRGLRRAPNDPVAPLALYHLSDCLWRLGRDGDAAAAHRQAMAHSPVLCFPNRLEDIAVLEAAMARRVDDARAPYYLGNLWYDRRQHGRAVECWERARDLDPVFPTVWRNLGLAYFNARGDVDAAWRSYERAFELDRTDARVLFELDHLARRLGHPLRGRLERLERYAALVELRDDVFLERVTLVNLLGHHARALGELLSRRFHPWEGGEGKVPAQYALALTQLARRALEDGRPGQAVDLLRRTQTWPESLGEGKLLGIRENDVHYLLGCAHRELGDESAAREAFEHAAAGLDEPTSALYYNDQPPDMIFYQGLACRALGRENAARSRFERLVAYGREHIDEEVEVDYFAVSLPDFLVFEDDLKARNRAHCRYMMALGELGLGRLEEARRKLDEILAADPAHVGATVHRPLTTHERSDPR